MPTALGLAGCFHGLSCCQSGHRLSKGLCALLTPEPCGHVTSFSSEGNKWRLLAASAYALWFRVWEPQTLNPEPQIVRGDNCIEAATWDYSAFTLSLWSWSEVPRLYLLSLLKQLLLQLLQGLLVLGRSFSLSSLSSPPSLSHLHASSA